MVDEQERGGERTSLRYFSLSQRDRSYLLAVGTDEAIGMIAGSRTCVVENGFEGEVKRATFLPQTETGARVLCCLARTY